MYKYSYNMGPKRFGTIRADSPFKAAKKLLKDRPIFVSGTKYTMPWIYLEAHETTELKLWKLDEDLGPSQADMLIYSGL
jgi:hypothetical protein